MLQDMWNAPPGFRPTKSAPSSPAKPIGVLRTRSESFHVAHKVPVGDTPYVRAKNVQLVDKDPEKAIPLFWAAINSGDRVDSALKDMAIVMKQQNRAEEAIEAIKSLRHRCSDQAQESLDNILLDLYKRCGRLDDQVGLLRHKLFLIQKGLAFNGKRTKTARSQGKKFQVSVEQEATRLLGNLGWALMQQHNYVEAEDAYRRALTISADNNKMCNLGICLMKQGRISEAKENLRRVRPAVADGPRGTDSHLKAYERAQQMLNDLESDLLTRCGSDRVEQSRLFDAFLGSSSIWQPHPCRDYSSSSTAATSASLPDEFGDENVNSSNSLNVSAKPFYPPPTVSGGGETLKRTRSLVGGLEKKPVLAEIGVIENNKTRRLSAEKADLLSLPDSKDFEDAIMAAVLGSKPIVESGEPAQKEVQKKPVTESSSSSSVAVPVPVQVQVQRKVEKRLKVFQDITLSLSPTPTPRA